MPPTAEQSTASSANTVVHLPSRPLLEERLNTWSHGIFALISVFTGLYLVYLAAQSGRLYATVVASVYSTVVLLMYSSSAIYHGSKTVLGKRRWRILDHCAIFLFIPGNYTPLFLLLLGDTTSLWLLGALWLAAFVGVFLKTKFTGRYEWLFIVVLVTMSWIGLVQGHNLYQVIPVMAFHMMWIGGAIYTSGVFFYRMEGRLPYAHLIWHLFVIGGCSTHYLMMVWYVFG